MRMNAAEDLIRILERLYKEPLEGHEGWSAGIIPLVYGPYKDGQKLYAIGAIKDRYYPAAPFQFTHPIGYAEKEGNTTTATRELNEEIIASREPNREMLFTKLNEGFDPWPLFIGDNRDVAKETARESVRRINEDIGRKVFRNTTDHYHQPLVYGWAENETKANSKGKKWRDISYVVCLGALEGIAAFDAEEFRGERLDRQIVAIPVRSLKAENVGKPIESTGALAFYNGRWISLSEYMKTEEFGERYERLYRDDKLGYIPFIPHPLLLKIYDPEGLKQLVELDIPGIARPANSYGEAIEKYRELRMKYKIHQSSSGKRI